MRQSKFFIAAIIIAMLATIVIGCEPEPPTTGDIQGKLISAETEEPLTGAAIILGLVTGESECTLQSDLVASVDANGAFALTNVPAGTYVVFYDPSGEAKDSWKNIDKLQINYLNWFEAHYPLATSEEFYNSFGGGGDIILPKPFITQWDENGVSNSEGVFTSVRYGLTMEFHDNNPITLEVKAGETTNVEIMAMAMTMATE